MTSFYASLLATSPKQKCRSSHSVGLRRRPLALRIPLPLRRADAVATQLPVSGVRSCAGPGDVRFGHGEGRPTFSAAEWRAGSPTQPSCCIATTRLIRSRLWCRFLGRREVTVWQAASDGVREAPRHEIAGGEAPAVRLALWGFEPCCGADGKGHSWRQRPQPARVSVRIPCEGLCGCDFRGRGEPSWWHEACGIVASGEPAER